MATKTAWRFVLVTCPETRAPLTTGMTSLVLGMTRQHSSAGTMKRGCCEKPEVLTLAVNRQLMCPAMYAPLGRTQTPLGACHVRREHTRLEPTRACAWRVLQGCMMEMVIRLPPVLRARPTILQTLAAQPSATSAQLKRPPTQVNRSVAQLLHNAFIPRHALQICRAPHNVVSCTSPRISVMQPLNHSVIGRGEPWPL